MSPSRQWTEPGQVIDGPLRHVRERLEQRATGRTLELTPGKPREPWPAGSCDTVLSLGWLPGQADLPGAVAQLASLLAPRGRLILLEPVPELGWRRTAAFVASVFRRGGLHLDRDVSAVVWSTGLRIVDVERFTVEGAALGLRRWLAGVACFPPTADLPELVPARRPGARETEPVEEDT